MSHFYGSIEGNGGEATRCGTKTSGIVAKVRSWSGNCFAWLVHNEFTNLDELAIDIQPEHGASIRLLTVEDYGAMLRAVQHKDPDVLAAIREVQEAGYRLSNATYKVA
jgi:hypothetical protein